MVRLEIRLDAILQSAILQKQVIIIDLTQRSSENQIES